MGEGYWAGSWWASGYWGSGYWGSGGAPAGPTGCGGGGGFFSFLNVPVMQPEGVAVPSAPAAPPTPVAPANARGRFAVRRIRRNRKLWLLVRDYLEFQLKKEEAG